MRRARRRSIGERTHVHSRVGTPRQREALFANAKEANFHRISSEPNRSGLAGRRELSIIISTGYAILGSVESHREWLRGRVADR
ncbi:MAG: hypothetical protein BWY17_03043 [Deltaproteobacteria bacterium ADurb.Bin207]|jgi:hypothetical protein|nr:MAG: hypothetical protein BWY17_03043 [Deltaproteobacteria bacterium ADurb.Bin207]